MTVRLHGAGMPVRSLARTTAPLRASYSSGRPARRSHSMLLPDSGGLSRSLVSMAVGRSSGSLAPSARPMSRASSISARPSSAICGSRNTGTLWQVQCGDRAACDVLAQLAPCCGQEVSGEVRRDPSTGHQLREVQAVWVIGDLQTRIAVQPDPSSPERLSRKVDDHGDHSARDERRDPILVLDSVLQHGDSSARARQGSKPRRGGTGLVRFGGEQYPVDHADLVGIGFLAHGGPQFHAGQAPDCELRNQRAYARHYLATPGFGQVRDHRPADSADSYHRHRGHCHSVGAELREAMGRLRVHHLPEGSPSKTRPDFDDGDYLALALALA